jgi:hypothetical protein
VGQQAQSYSDEQKEFEDEPPATRKALGSDQIACRTTFSNMDAADERDASSGAEAMDSEASSTLLAFAQSAQGVASVSREEDYKAHTSTSSAKKLDNNGEGLAFLQSIRAPSTGSTDTPIFLYHPTVFNTAQLLKYLPRKHKRKSDPYTAQTVTVVSFRCAPSSTCCKASARLC